MTNGPIVARVTRGSMVESVHTGHAAIVGPGGDLLYALGDPDRAIYPRSSCKMLQALPLIESGAADAYHLNPRHLALACASHEGARIHAGLAQAWLAGLGLSEADLRCGPQRPADAEEREALRAAKAPCQLHNNCSGKHSGFLTLNQHLGGGAEYTEIDHPVQNTVRAAFEDMTGENSQHWGIDGCSAPNFSCSIRGLARSMALMARPESLGQARAAAAKRLVQAMMAHPILVSGTGRACLELTEGLNGKGAVKTGAEGVFTAILPGLGLGIALKVDDGATRAAEAMMAALLVKIGALDRVHPAVQNRTHAEVRSRRGLLAGHVAVDDALFAPVDRAAFRG